MDSRDFLFLTLILIQLALQPARRRAGSLSSGHCLAPFGGCIDWQRSRSACRRISLVFGHEGALLLHFAFITQKRGITGAGPRVGVKEMEACL